MLWFKKEGPEHRLSTANPFIGKILKKKNVSLNEEMEEENLLGILIPE